MLSLMAVLAPRLGLLEGGRRAAIAVVRGPLKFPAVVLVGDEVTRLIAANVDVGEGMGHWYSARLQLG